MSKTCNETVTSDGWHFKRCHKPAKWICLIPSGFQKPKDTKGYRCGIHARRYKKLAAFSKETALKT